MSAEYDRGYRDGYRAGKEVGLSESARMGEIATLREQLARHQNAAPAPIPEEQS